MLKKALSPLVMMRLCGSLRILGGISAAKLAMETLLERSGSDPLADTVMPLVKKPAFVARIEMLITALLPGARSPREQRTPVMSLVQEPWLEAKDVRSRSCGMESNAVTCVTRAGPALEIVTVKTTLLPTAIASGRSTAAMERSAIGVFVAMVRLHPPARTPVLLSEWSRM